MIHDPHGVEHWPVWEGGEKVQSPEYGVEEYSYDQFRVYKIDVLERADNKRAVKLTPIAEFKTQKDADDYCDIYRGRAL